MTPTPRRLLLVRHGETDWNRQSRLQGITDTPLNEAGRRQSRALAERLRGADVDALYTSPLVRAAETARIVGAEIGRTPVPVADLRERDMGAWCGLTWDEVRERWPDDWRRALDGEDVPLGGGETMAQVQSRVGPAVEELVARHAGECVLVVSHGLALRVLVCRLLGLDIRHAGRLATGANTSVTEFEFRRGVPRLAVFADDSHLRLAPKP